ncbi:hypothetical protein BG842_18400 [Haladaptatus sp. W1]|uniref:hypothetical protein n=1 Tax=Haladaptatus sp. W1 TaxID=1897478 RepID=UPI000849A1D0|nr:hypothetical protein [Haladaptatus sp. W1]ODR82548.1 hypothetical protein BG842_18400 [Haladaptatus sp. W1]
MSGLSITLSERQYRRIDQLTKLLGVVLVAVGLELGGSTFAGIAFGALGVCIALLTVFMDYEQ